MIIVVSEDPDAKSKPFGEKHTQFTSSVCGWIYYSYRIVIGTKC